MEQTSISRIQSSLVLLASILFHVLLFLISSSDPLHLKFDLFSFFSPNKTFKADYLLSSGQAEPIVSFSFTYDPEPSKRPITQDNVDMGKTIVEHKAENMPIPLEEAPDATTYITQKEPTAPLSAQTTQPETIQPAPINQPHLTLADISRGFLKSTQQHAGHNKAAQDMKQLALQSYATKVWHLIKTSFLSGDCCLHLKHDVHVQTELLVTIDREGTLINIQLQYPKEITQLQDIEELIINRAQKAGLFPPLPKEITGQTKRFSFPLLIEAEQGLHSYALSYR